MKKEPFIIALNNEDLPNLSQADKEDFGFEFSQTNLWREDNKDKIRILEQINEKLDFIIRIINKNGKE
ncbi:MAG: hypothetical protein IKU54_02580 [Oscillospiraceae bacterium]|nr:hypothetical protein [Oscillospiraceae bacterium]